MHRNILVATRNQGKLGEIQKILKPYGITIVSPEGAGIAPDFDVEETGKTFSANAYLKARGYALESGITALADDSGLAVDALDGAPGVYSKRYGSHDEERIQRLLAELATHENERAARFVCVVCLFDPKTGVSESEKGVVEGEITDRPIGRGGFGYDPIFFSSELGKTFAEASSAEKNDISHRSRALRALFDRLP